MKRTRMLTIASLLSILLMIFHFIIMLIGGLAGLGMPAIHMALARPSSTTRSPGPGGTTSSSGCFSRSA